MIKLKLVDKSCKRQKKHLKTEQLKIENQLNKRFNSLKEIFKIIECKLKNGKKEHRLLTLNQKKDRDNYRLFNRVPLNGNKKHKKLNGNRNKKFKNWSCN